MIATATKESWLQDRFPEVVGVMVAGGFALTLGELLLMGHTEKSQNLAVLMTAAGMLATVVGLVAAPRFRKLFAGLLIVVAAGGLFGVYEHLEEGMEHKEKAAKASQERAQAVQLADVDRSDRGHGEHEKGGHDGDEEHGPPPLAPLSVSGLALMGSLGLIASRR